MPLYTYHCNDCGPFESWASMAQASEPCACPSCSTPGRRELASPHLSLMNPTLRKAYDRSEKSGSEPQVVKRKHLAGCGCSICKVGKKTNNVRKKWMIGH